MDRGLRERIKEQAGNHCRICFKCCGHTGSPHHVVKVSEEKLLENCKKNIMWTCIECHHKTEQVPGYNRQLQKKLQKEYFRIFNTQKHYTTKEIAEIVTMPVKDIEKAMQKNLLKWEFVESIPKANGNEVIRFLMGGYFK